jgi:hypothetical protein
MSKTTLAEFLANPQTGSYDAEGNFDCGVWYDWFCSEKALINRGKVLLGKVRAISKSKKFDNDKCYVFFKNNCPMSGPLYDSFSICDIETGNVLYWVTYQSGHSGLAEVSGGINEVDEFGTLVQGKWSDVKNFFLK